MNGNLSGTTNFSNCKLYTSFRESDLGQGIAHIYSGDANDDESGSTTSNYLFTGLT